MFNTISSARLPLTISIKHQQVLQYSTKILHSRSLSLSKSVAMSNKNKDTIEMLPVLCTHLFQCLSQVLINLAICSQSSTSLFQCLSFILGSIKEHILHILKHKCSVCKYAEIEVYQPEQRDYTLMMDSVVG